VEKARIKRRTKMPYRGDSFVVYIQNPVDTFPLIRVSKRRRARRRGRVEVESQIGLIGNQNSFVGANYEETARQIGMLILNNSDIIRNFRAQ